MRFKLAEGLCYFAGLVCKTNESERSQLGIKTTRDEIAEGFVKTALDLGVDSTKIMVEEKESIKHLYIYHSKLARIVQEILRQRSTLPMKGREFAKAFIAGIFDANGHITKGTANIRKLDKGDELLLELMGVHTLNGKVLNPKYFISIIKDWSIIASGKA